MKPRSTGAASFLTVACAAGLLALANLGVAFFREAAPAAPSARTAAIALLDEVRAIAADPAGRSRLEALGVALAGHEEELIGIAREAAHPRRAEAVFALRYARGARVEAALVDVAGSSDPAIAALAEESLDAARPRACGATF